MSAYNFQKQFAGKVESGDKRQTIRADGKRRHARPGERVQLYTGMMTKACRKLVNPDPICTSVEPVRIAYSGPTGQPHVTVSGHPLTRPEIRALARDDGFENVTSMYAWLEKTHGLPFRGVLIKWRPEAA
ncbi:ASCH domain-containing protein [Desulfocurvus sp. DL9XJH121]